jgi:hypothetical protein
MGTHQELLARRGLYWRLYRLQYADGGGPVTGDLVGGQLQAGD